MQQHGLKYFARRPLPTHPTPDPADGSKVRNLTISEHGHVAYQIKENHECSTMLAYILPAATPTLRTLGWDQ